MALAANAFFTVAAVRGFFPTWAADADSLIELYINAVSAEIESFCHDKFVQRQETLVFDGNDRQTLDLGSRAVSVSEVREGDNFQAATGTIRDPVVYPYGVQPKYGILFSSFKWKFGVQNVQVKATVGWDAVPADLQMTALRLIKRVHDAKFGIVTLAHRQSESIGEYSYTLAPGVSFHDVLGSDQATVLRYRRWVLA